MNFSRLSLILTLLIFMLSGFLIVDYFYNVTKDPISQIEIKKHQKIIKNLMPLDYDNDLLKDRIEVTAFGDLGTNNPVKIYRASKKDNSKIGIIILPIAPDGYNGLIKLAVGLNYAGEIIAIHILEHNETLGFGDEIDQKKSTWLSSFIGKDSSAFKNKKLSGIDQISGASVSSLAVIKSVEKCLAFYEREKYRLWEMPLIKIQ